MRPPRPTGATAQKPGPICSRPEFPARPRSKRAGNVVDEPGAPQPSRGKKDQLLLIRGSAKRDLRPVSQ